MFSQRFVHLPLSLQERGPGGEVQTGRVCPLSEPRLSIHPSPRGLGALETNGVTKESTDLY